MNRDEQPNDEGGADELAKRINYPIWAHAQYATARDDLVDLAGSLGPGDVVQVNDYEQPLAVESLSRGVIHFATAQETRHTAYSLEYEGGSDHGLYFNHGVGRSGVERMAVIYRDDDSISPLSLDYLLELTHEHGVESRYEVTWEDVNRTVEPADPRAPLEEQQQAMDRVIAGEPPEEVEGAQTAYEFIERTRVVDKLAPPFDYSYPAGTLYFRFDEPEGDETIERVVPIDQVESVRHLGD